MEAGETVRIAHDPTRPRPVSLVRLGINAAATFVVIVTFGLAVLATAPMLFGYGSVVVVSGSMEPSIHVGDVVLTAATDGEDLGVGTVINHRVPDSMRLHRITETVADRYRTEGDANRSSDSDLVAPEQILGVGIALVPFVGLPRVWIDQGDWLRLGVAIGVLLMAMHASRRAFLQPAPGAWGGA